MNNQQNPNQQYYQNSNPNPNPNQQYYQQPYAPNFNPNDKTAEFDAKDISDNKVWALLPHLAGIIGILIAKICAPNSSFVDFHARQVMKFFIVNWVVSIISILLCWTFIVPIAGVIFMCVLGVIQIITFIQACMGKAVEPAIVRSIGFLK